jgi:hypothetical protein
MTALRIQMHLHGNASLLQRNVVNQRVVYIVHGVILRLQQKRRRRLVGDGDIRIQLKLLIVNPQTNAGPLAGFGHAVGALNSRQTQLGLEYEF